MVERDIGERVERERERCGRGVRESEGREQGGARGDLDIFRVCLLFTEVISIMCPLERNLGP
jgi:hypothetical protein